MPGMKNFSCICITMGKEFSPNNGLEKFLVKCETDAWHHLISNRAFEHVAFFPLDPNVIPEEIFALSTVTEFANPQPLGTSTPKSQKATSSASRGGCYDTSSLSASPEPGPSGTGHWTRTPEQNFPTHMVRQDDTDEKSVLDLDDIKFSFLDLMPSPKKGKSFWLNLVHPLNLVCTIQLWWQNWFKPWFKVELRLNCYCTIGPKFSQCSLGLYGPTKSNNGTW